MNIVIAVLTFGVLLCSNSIQAHVHHVHKKEQHSHELSKLSFDELESHLKMNKLVVTQKYNHEALLKELERRVNSHQPMGYFWLANLKQRDHEFKPALKMLEYYLDLQPNNVNALLLKANIETVIGQYDQALASCFSLAPLHSVDLAMLCSLDVKMQTEPITPIIDKLKSSALRRGNNELATFAQELYVTALYFDQQYALALAELEPIMERQLASSTWILYADLLNQLGKFNQFATKFEQLGLEDEEIPDAILVRLAHVRPKEWLLVARERMSSRLNKDANNYSDALAYYFYHVVDNPIQALHWAKVQSQISSLRIDKLLYRNIEKQLQVHHSKAL